ncbi:MAG: hypothetical protein GY715_08550 [Planctomycetes bacterium]|nr:hypothetical protein [Planctomycetota bacterium]
MREAESDGATERRSDEGDDERSRPAVRFVCYAISAVLLAGAGAFLLFGNDKGLGIFFVLIAAVLSRVLVLNIAERDAR